MNLLRANVAIVPEKISATDLILSLRQRIEDVLKLLILPGESVALLDFPDYCNAGDSAIWVGTRILLRKLGVRIRYVCDIKHYSRKSLAQKIGNGTILLNGGGNFGDLWSEHQIFREKVITDFPNNKIIQLPQSIFFENRENLQRAKKAFNSHPDLTLLVRDQQSLDFARREFHAQSILCPDMAFALDVPPSILNRESHDVVGLLRTDSERLSAVLPEEFKNLRKLDWLNDDESLLHWIYGKVYGGSGNFSTRSVLLEKFRPLFYECLAHSRLMRGMRLLSGAKVLITDRLHGHILSLLLGIPHVVMDNNYGKIRSFYETWTKDSNITFWANSLEEAWHICEDYS